MSNLIIGVIGVILSIGVAVAGASFLGANFTNSRVRTDATAGMETLARVAAAVQVRDRERELATSATSTLADILVPAYLEDMPANPFGGPSLFLLGDGGATTGPAAFVAMKVVGGNADSICDSISKQGLGPAVAPTASWPTPARSVGCFKAASSLGSAVQAGELIAYARTS